MPQQLFPPNKTETWQEQLRTAIKTIAQLEDFFEINFQGSSELLKHYPVFIPNWFAKIIKLAGPTSALWKQFIPDQDELINWGLTDPIGDEVHHVAPQLIHRYSSRVLFTPTAICPINCRYCFRKNELSHGVDFLSPDFVQTVQYLKAHPEISEIIFTGGDPLILSNQKIFQYLKSFSEIKSLKFIRFHSRVPIILPQRIDRDLKKIIELFGSVFDSLILVIHINHPSEITSLFKQKIKSLKNCQIMTQTVLLKDINDSANVLNQLLCELGKMQIRPYYLHHPDQAKGTKHFYLNLSEGRKIYHQLRDLCPGWLLPHYVIDIPGGHGKTLAYNSESFNFSGQFINRQGQLVAVDKNVLGC